MRRETSLTFEGALRILGHSEPGWIKKLDTLLGGAILIAGAGAGVAAIGPAALTPLKMFEAVWGWLEQRDEAIGLLGQAVSALSGKLAGTAGRERRELIAAAHTTIVVASFFEIFKKNVGKEFYNQLQITDQEKAALISRSDDWDGNIYEKLYVAEVPAPSAARGFEQNIRGIQNWYSQLADDFSKFIDESSAAKHYRFDWRIIINSSVERYRSRFLELAAKVPEFMIWSLLGESAAIQSAVTGLRVEIAAALDANRDALGRIKALLSLDVGQGGGMLDLWQAVAWANGGILSERIIPEDGRGYVGIEFPMVGESYINPRYRLTLAGNPSVTTERQAGGSVRPADEQDWDSLPSRDDFDLMFAGYVISPDAARLPMLLLGHPGSGKSMLTKVLAARLPTSAYTVIRVPLRRVGANAPVVAQIERALADATNGRVDSWWRLAEQCADTTRVVLLDGLDELLQASQVDRSGYIQEVVEFQRHEAEQRQPVVVIVTSRTVVADRVDIPQGTTVVKLDMFKEPDIAEWLSRWRKANVIAITSGKMRELTVRSALRQRELAQQPLLLLMLALYAADPALPGLDGGLSTSDLYQRLIESFARREAIKTLGPNPQRNELTRRAQDHLDRLAIAALGMFNRGRQDISEDELGTDLSALDQRLMQRSRPIEAGQRIIGEFFFVHAPEAQTLTGAGGSADSPVERGATRRAYEFLHATFGEYLVARRIMDELVDAAAKTFARRRGPAEPDDDLLYTLLSHQAFAARRSTLAFAKEVSNGLPENDRIQVLEVLEMLLGSYRHRRVANKYSGYHPTSHDQVRELACYSANLVALRATLEPEGGIIPLTQLLRAPNSALANWQSTVTLWKAGLDADGSRSMTAELIELCGNPPGIRLADTKPTIRWNNGPGRPVADIRAARLISDLPAERILRHGAAVTDGFVYLSGDDWVSEAASCLVAGIVGRSDVVDFPPPPEGTPDDEIAFVVQLIYTYFRCRRSRSADLRLLRNLFNFPRPFAIDPLALTAAVLSNFDLLYEIPELSDRKVYGQYAPLLWQSTPQSIDFKSLPAEAREAIRILLIQWVS